MPDTPAVISFTAAELHSLVTHLRDDGEAIAAKFNQADIAAKLDSAVKAIDTPQGMAVLSVLANLAATAFGAPEQLKSLTFIAGVVEELIKALAHPAPLPA